MPELESSDLGYVLGEARGVLTGSGGDGWPSVLKQLVSELHSSDLICVAERDALLAGKPMAPRNAEARRRLGRFARSLRDEQLIAAADGSGALQVASPRAHVDSCLSYGWPAG